MKTSRVMKIVMKKHLGQEPEENSIIENMIPALNYYSATYDRKDAIRFFEIYMSEADPEFLDRRNYEKLSTTVGWVSRLLSIGCSLPEETMNWFKNEIDAMPAQLTVVSDLAPINDPYHFKIIADIEEKFDNSDFDFSYLSDLNLSWAVSNKVTKFFKRRLEELEGIETDIQLNEAYSCFTEDEIEAIKDGLVSLLNILGMNVKRTKKVRKVKAKAPEDIVKAIELKMKDPDLGLRSYNPTKIIGATTLVFYTGVHRTIQIYHAIEGKTFEVSGKSLVNFDPEKSRGKKIRKPEIVATAFASGGLKRILKEFDNLTTKEWIQKTGRISTEHMLIAAF